MEIPSGVRRRIRYWFFCNLTSTLVANGTRSRLISRLKGLFQGTILSPTLCKIYTNPLLIRFSVQSGSRMSLVLLVILASAERPQNMYLVTAHPDDQISIICNDECDIYAYYCVLWCFGLSFIVSITSITRLYILELLSTALDVRYDFFLALYIACHA